MCSTANIRTYYRSTNYTNANGNRKYRIANHSDTDKSITYNFIANHSNSYHGVANYTNAYNCIADYSNAYN
jgi:hypothetical protein